MGDIDLAERAGPIAPCLWGGLQRTNLLSTLQRMVPVVESPREARAARVNIIARGKQVTCDRSGPKSEVSQLYANSSGS